MKEPLSSLSSISYFVAAFATLDLLPPSWTVYFIAFSLVLLGIGSALFHATHSDSTESIDQLGIYASFLSIFVYLWTTSLPGALPVAAWITPIAFLALTVHAIRRPDEKTFRSAYLFALVVTNMILLWTITDTLVYSVVIFVTYVAAVFVYLLGNAIESHGVPHAADSIHAFFWHPLTALLFYATLYFTQTA